MHSGGVALTGPPGGCCWWNGGSKKLGTWPQEWDSFSNGKC